MVGSYFLYYNEFLQKLELPNLTKADYNFLYYNIFLRELYVPNLTMVNYPFLYYNHELRTKVLSEIESRDTKNKKRIR